MVVAWWLRAPEFLADCNRPTTGSGCASRYRFAERCLVLDSEDEALVRRFQQIYPEGMDGSAVADASRDVRCVVRVQNETRHHQAPCDEAALAAVFFDDPEPLDSFAFCQSLFPDRGYVEGPPGSDGWRTISDRRTPGEPLLALKDNYVLVDRRQIWQPFIANYAINRVLRLQHEILFFHAGSIGIQGHGLMIVGPKASGKTTTAMALAARGHDFLGDEMAAVHRATKAMLPFRRAVSIRPGPRARRVDEHLSRCHYPVEKFPDGGERTLVNLGNMFPEAGASQATLSSVLFLRQFAERPVAEPFAFGLEHFQMLSPLACSMWGMPLGARIMDMTRLLRGVRCYLLDPGQPEDTADLVEQIAIGRYLN